MKDFRSILDACNLHEIRIRVALSFSIIKNLEVLVLRNYLTDYVPPLTGSFCNLFGMFLNLLPLTLITPLSWLALALGIVVRWSTRSRATNCVSNNNGRTNRIVKILFKIYRTVVFTLVWTLVVGILHYGKIKIIKLCFARFKSLESHIKSFKGLSAS